MNLVVSTSESMTRPAAGLVPLDAASPVRPNRPPRLNRIVASWHAAVDYLVPIGYEDESGFQFGEDPVNRELDGEGESTEASRVDQE